jgi:hypothetical protein
MCAGKCAFLDGNVVDDVNAVHIDMRIRKGAQPAAIELNARRLSLPTHPAWRLKDGVVREYFRKPNNVVGIERFGPSLERLAHCHGHRKSPFIVFSDRMGRTSAMEWVI